MLQRVFKIKVMTHSDVTIVISLGVSQIEAGAGALWPGGALSGEARGGTGDLEELLFGSMTVINVSHRALLPEDRIRIRMRTPSQGDHLRVVTAHNPVDAGL
jgi:hypothetical protein